MTHLLNETRALIDSTEARVLAHPESRFHRSLLSQVADLRAYFDHLSSGKSAEQARWAAVIRESAAGIARCLEREGA